MACGTGAGLAGGWGAAAIALVASLPLIWHRAHPRFLLTAAAALAALVPLAWGVGNAGRVGEVSARLVTENPLPGWLAAAAVAVALTGVVLDVVPAVRSDHGPDVGRAATGRAPAPRSGRSSIPYDPKETDDVV